MGKPDKCKCKCNHPGDVVTCCRCTCPVKGDKCPCCDMTISVAAAIARRKYPGHS
jgi:hypothetical protein